MKCKKKIAAAMAVVVLTTTMTPVVNTTSVQARTTYVYVTSSGNGTRYHMSRNCRTLRRSRVVRMKLRRARNQGYTKCRVCG